jgi:hypothetical protein
VPGQLLIAMLGSLTYAVIQEPVSGWTAAPVLALFAVAAAFILVERSRTEPLVELRFFRSRPFTGAAGMALLLALAPGTSYLYLAVALAVLGAGLGLVNPPITGTAVSGMPPAQALRRGGPPDVVEQRQHDDHVRVRQQWQPDEVRGQDLHLRRP